MQREIRESCREIEMYREREREMQTEMQREMQRERDGDYIIEENRRKNYEI